MPNLTKTSTQIYEESGLTFRFAPGVSVIKYDEHRFFQAISGAGLRGVDFLGLWPEGRLTLIEVKHYRHPLGKGAHPAEEILATPAPLIEAIARKVEDTLYGIQVVQAYLQRKWPYRLWRRLHRYIPFLDARVPEWVFWTSLAQTTQIEKPIQAVLWLEAEGLELNPKRVGELETGLRGALAERLPGRKVRLVMASGEKPFPGILILNEK